MSAQRVPTVPPETATAADGFEVLDQCHRQMLAMLDQLGELVSRLASVGADPIVRAAARAVVDFFSRLDVSTDVTHDRIEESRAAGREHELQGLSGADLSALARKTAAAGQQLLMTNLTRLREAAHGFSFARAYRDDLIGLTALWVVVGMLVGIAWVILQLG